MSTHSTLATPALSPQLAELQAITEAIEQAVSTQQWDEALELDQRRFQQIQRLPPQLFAAADTATIAVLQGILNAVQDLEARVVEARDRCHGERQNFAHTRRAATQYESIRQV